MKVCLDCGTSYENKNEKCPYCKSTRNRILKKGEAYNAPNYAKTNEDEEAYKAGYYAGLARHNFGVSVRLMDYTNNSKVLEGYKDGVKAKIVLAGVILGIVFTFLLILTLVLIFTVV